MKNRIVAAQASYIIPRSPEGRILVGRRCNTGYMDGVWQVFAGHVEIWEMPIGAMVREAFEELGITVSDETLTLLHVSCRPRHDETGNRVDFYFEARGWEGYVMNKEPAKCSEMAWVYSNQLPEPFTPHVRYALDCISRGIFYSELTLEWMKQQTLYGLA